jgi:hypothetical protein
MGLVFLNITNWLEEHQLPCLFKSITHFDYNSWRVFGKPWKPAILSLTLQEFDKFLYNEQEDGVCILTGKTSKERVLFARAY